MANGKVKASILTLILCLAAAVISVVLFLGAVGESALEGSMIGDFSALGSEVIAFDEADDGLWLVTNAESNGHILKLDKSTGEILFRNELKYPVRKAVPIGSSLFIFYEDDVSTILAEFSSELELISETTYPANIGELAFYTVTADGICLVRLDSRNVLELISAAGETEAMPFEHEIQFLEAAQDGTVFLCADDSLFQLNGNSLTELDYSVCPVKLLDSEHFIDSNSYLCEIEDNTVSLLLECSAAYNYELAVMADDNEGVILSQSTDKLSLFDFNGEVIGSLAVDAKLLGAVPSGALFEKNSAFYYASHVFTAPEPEPVYEPELYSGEGWLAEPQLGIIEVVKGFGASELIEAFRPYAETVHTSEGVEIISGKLATGMTIGEYDIVIRGDCSGNGEVNGTDILLLQRVIIGIEDISGAYRIAADVDADGELTTLDLVWMAMIKNGKVEPQLRYEVDQISVWSE